MSLCGVMRQGGAALDARGDWESGNPLRRWLDSGRGDTYDVTNATGITRERQEILMQGLGEPTPEELEKLAVLLEDPELASHWREWGSADPDIQTGAI